MVALEPSEPARGLEDEDVSLDGTGGQRDGLVEIQLRASECASSPRDVVREAGLVATSYEYYLRRVGA